MFSMNLGGIGCANLKFVRGHVESSTVDEHESNLSLSDSGCDSEAANSSAVDEHVSNSSPSDSRAADSSWTILSRSASSFAASSSTSARRALIFARSSSASPAADRSIRRTLSTLAPKASSSWFFALAETAISRDIRSYTACQSFPIRSWRSIVIRSSVYFSRSIIDSRDAIKCSSAMSSSSKNSATLFMHSHSSQNSLLQHSYGANRAIDRNIMTRAGIDKSPSL